MTDESIYQKYRRADVSMASQEAMPEQDPREPNPMYYMGIGGVELGCQKLAAMRKPEYWVLQRTMDGWRLYNDHAFPSSERAKAYISAAQPNSYKILEVIASYKTQVSLLPLAED
jgi:hypothetical protein